VCKSWLDFCLCVYIAGLGLGICVCNVHYLWSMSWSKLFTWLCVSVKVRFLLGLCFFYQVLLLFGHIWKVKLLTTILVSLHSTLVCCALISDSFLNQCYALGVCVYLLACVCMWMLAAVNCNLFCLSCVFGVCVCLFIYIRINTNILEKLLGIEQV